MKKKKNPTARTQSHKKNNRWISSETEETPKHPQRLNNSLTYFPFISRNTIRATSNKRTCKAGAGQEKNEGKCDTPGFTLHMEPQVKFDHKRSQKLYMPRNHNRVNQTSTDLLLSWRANCDVQLLVYNCDPLCPDLVEIARVTDYVVSYSCKGNATIKEEREQIRSLILK